MRHPLPLNPISVLGVAAVVSGHLSVSTTVRGQVTVVQSFDGISNPETPENFGSVGADTTLAAGIDHLVTIVNRQIRVIKKADGTTADEADLGDFLGVDAAVRGAWAHRGRAGTVGHVRAAPGMGMRRSGRPRVGWLFSLARSGTSVACYAAAAPWALPVADEPFGPWDRTRPPFDLPPVQADLMRAFAEDDLRLTPRVVALAEDLFAEMAGPAGRVVCKVPHIDPSPEDFARALDHRRHRAVFLLRNPLHRLNSLHLRGWLGACGPNHDLERFRLFARRWARAEHRLVYDDLRGDPRVFMAQMYRGWGWSATERDLARAVRHARGQYHYRSKRVDEQADPSRVLAEQDFALPPEAVLAYLGDPEIADLMRSLGWATDAGAYSGRAAAGCS
jgi:hypothetical protein